MRFGDWLPTDGYTPLELELRSRIGHLAGPRVPSVDFEGAVTGAPDLQAGCTIRKVERTGQHKESWMQPWYNNHANLAALWRYLERTSAVTVDPAHFLDEPWSYEPEFNRMLNEQPGLAA